MGKRELTGHTISQAQLIYKHMLEHGSISQRDAVIHYDCYRLSARIADLKAKGIQIKKENVKSKNKYGHHVSYARYSLKEAE